MFASRWSGWIVAATFYLFDVFLRLTVDVITSELQAEFHLSADAVTAAFSASFFYAYAAMQLPTGFLLDVLGPRWTIILSSLLSSVGCVLFSYAETATLGTVARALSGIGCGCGWLGAVKVTRNSFGIRDSQFTRAIFAVTCMLGGVGGLISQEPFQLLVTAVGWRVAFRVAAIIPVCIACCSFFFVSNVAHQAAPPLDPGTIEDPLLLAFPSTVVAAAAAAADDDATDALMSEHHELPVPSSWSVLQRCLRTPRMWAYAMYLGGTDAPFETFAGLWGVTFLHQVYEWSKSQAAAATTVVVVLSTVAQIFSGTLMGYVTSMHARLRVMTALSLLGFISFLPFVLAPLGKTSPPGGDGVAYGALISLGLSVASCTIIWSIISSDALCAGTASTGIVSGAVNTLCIFYDAVVQQVTGAVLSATWNGQTNAAKEPVYDAHAFSRAFMVLAGSFVLATGASVFVSFSMHGKRNGQTRRDGIL